MHGAGAPRHEPLSAAGSLKETSSSYTPSYHNITIIPGNGSVEDGQYHEAIASHYSLTD